MTATSIVGGATGHVPGTTPYPWPWDGVLDARGTAVLLLEQSGAGGAGENVARNAGIVVAALRDSGALTVRVVTQRPTRTAAALASPGSAPLASMPPIDTDETVASRGVDGFFGGPLESVLRAAGIRRIILTGSGLETSVHSTMRTANDMGFECLLVVDACSPGDEALVPASVSMIEMSGGIFGAVGVTAGVVAAYARE